MNNFDNIKKENEELKEKLLLLEKENEELKEHLKKYTNGENNKRYYEKNKEKVKQQGAEYLKKISEENPEKLKEYRRNAYLKRKEKLKNLDSLH
jgi:hypothetical protein